jgi:CIC family chloride channel protein
MALPTTQEGLAQGRFGRIAHVVERWHFSKDLLMILLAMLVGLVSGYGAVGFHYLVEGVHILFYEPEHIGLPHLHFGEWWHVGKIIVLPTLGAFLAGTIVWLHARNDHAHGTAAVMEAVALHGGRLLPRPLLTKVTAAGVLIGGGGSAGPEDPSVQIGSVIGSSIGTRLHLSPVRVNTLVTAGVASAIAAAFNAPIAGVFFALEIVAGDFSTTLFAPVVLASVTSSIVGRSVLGEQPSFEAPLYTIINPFIEAPLYLLLGVVAAVIGGGLIHAIFFSEAVFEKTHLPRPFRACLGGALLGGIAVAVPGVLGSGYETAGEILHGIGPTGMLLLTLLIAKFLATVITLGAVGVGGTFAPAMVLGAMVGGLFGQVANLIFPNGMIAPPPAFALVGMGAVLTAVVRSPITAVLLLFEVTGDYYIILGIMASVVTSYIFSTLIHSESIYTERLVRKGIQLRFGRDFNILELVTIGEAMTPDFTTIPRNLTLRQLRTLFDDTHHHGFPVLDEEGMLVGMVTITDMQNALENGVSLDAYVDDITTRHLVVVSPDQTLAIAMQQFASADVGRLPVVSRENPRKLLGVVRRSDIVKAYQHGSRQRAKLESRHQHMRLSNQHNTQIIEVEILSNSPCDKRLVRDVRLPGQAIITSILREGLTIIPRGDTVMREGDQLAILTTPERAEEVREHILQGGQNQQRSGDEPRYQEITINYGAPAIGKTVADLGLPSDALIVNLRREGDVHTVHGDTVLEMGDQVTVMATQQDMCTAMYCLCGEMAKRPGGPCSEEKQEE